MWTRTDSQVVSKQRVPDEENSEVLEGHILTWALRLVRLHSHREDCGEHSTVGHLSVCSFGNNRTALGRKAALGSHRVVLAAVTAELPTFKDLWAEESH